MTEQNDVHVLTTDEFAREYRQLDSGRLQGLGKDDAIIRAGARVLLPEGEEEEQDVQDIEDHLVRTRAMYVAMLTEATELQRRLTSAREALRHELDRAPALQREFRALQGKQRITED